MWADQSQMYSYYGNNLKQNQKSQLIGHLANIYYYKNIKEQGMGKKVVTDYEVLNRYDYDGRKNAKLSKNPFSVENISMEDLFGSDLA